METNINANADPSLVAYCGLYCGACYKLKKGKCPGCAKNVKATWCKIRSCNIEHNYKSCADCVTNSHRSCKHMNNMISKLFSLVFKSDRNACIDRIKEISIDKYALEMHEKGMQSTRKR